MVQLLSSPVLNRVYLFRSSKQGSKNSPGAKDEQNTKEKQLTECLFSMIMLITPQKLEKPFCLFEKATQRHILPAFSSLTPTAGQKNCSVSSLGRFLRPMR